MDSADLARAVTDASYRADSNAAVGQLYENLAREVAIRRPVCVGSGRCCRFEEYGHRLFVTTMELGAFLSDYRAAGGKIPASAAWVGTGCPFQRDKLCTVHAIRPMGCRLFFCDASSTEWQNEQYEKFHAELKRLHETLDIPYAYMEWRAALKLIGMA
jgi:Fe-S-cluster containining protein